MSRRVVAITILAPVAEGRIDALRAAIDALEVGPGSPLARIAGLHVGRWLIVDELEVIAGRRAPPPGPFLLFAADIDPPEAAAFAAIATHCGEILRHCVGCPDPGDSRAFDSWLTDHRVPDGFTVMPYPDRPLSDVRRGLELRERLGAFAIASQGLDPVALQEMFLDDFPEVPV